MNLGREVLAEGDGVLEEDAVGEVVMSRRGFNVQEDCSRNAWSNIAGKGYRSDYAAAVGSANKEPPFFGDWL